MYYRIIRALLLALVSAVTFGGMAVARDMAAIKASGHLIVAVPAMTSPPFTFERNGELMGIDIDLVRSIADTLGVHPEFIRQGRTFNEAIDLVAAEQADMGIGKISRTVKRAANVLFTEPYATLNHALLVNRLRLAEMSGDRPVAEAMQSYGGSIGVIAGSSFADYAHSVFPHANIVEFDTWDQVVSAVAQGDVSAAYRDAFEARLVLKIHPDIAMKVRVIVIDDIQDTIGIAVSPSSFMLQNFLNVFLEVNKIHYDASKLISNYHE